MGDGAVLGEEEGGPVQAELGAPGGVAHAEFFAEQARECALARPDDSRKQASGSTLS